MFFALANQLGHDAEDVKEHAKKKFGVSCFNDIKSGQINLMIELFLEQKALRERIEWKKKVKSGETW